MWLGVALYDLVTYDYLETERVLNIIQEVWFPVIIPFSILVPIWFAYDNIKKGYLKDNSFFTKLKKLGMVIIMMFATFMVSLSFLQGAILISNRTIGKQNEVIINAKIINTKTTINRGRKSFYAIIRSEKLGRNIVLKTKKQYFTGDSLKIVMKSGYFDILYEK